MFDHAAELMAEVAQGHDVALAIVIGVDGSAPRPVGTSMLVTLDGRVHGSISGGCVESAVVARAELVLAGEDPTTELFGWTDATAFAAGLTCGGTIEVVVTRVGPATSADVLDRFAAAAVGNDSTVGVCSDGTFVTDVDPVARGVQRLDRCGDVMVVVSCRPAAQFVIYGALDVAAALASLARLNGYEVTVCDPRPTFTTAARFPDAHHVVVQRPDAHLASIPEDPRTVVCVLTHEERFETPVLAAALGRDVAYVGAMGSRATHRVRVERLLTAGVTAAELDRLNSPIGLDLGGSSPAETALSIMAEVVAVQNGRSGGRLRATAGPLHSTLRSGAAAPLPATPGRG